MDLSIEKRPTMDTKALQRLLRRKFLADVFARDEFRHSVFVGVDGGIVHGEPADKVGDAVEVKANGCVIGWVFGENSDSLATLLGATAELGMEIRALAAESLEKYRELSMLYSVSDKLLAAPDVKGVATIVCDEAQRFLRSDSVSVLLLNDETATLELAQSRGRPYHSRSLVEIRDDIVGTVLGSGTGEIVNDVAADHRSVHADNAFRSVICSPLRSKNRVFGVVLAGSESARHYNAADLQLLNALASQAAAAMDVARLYGDLKRRSAVPADLIYGLNDRPPFGALAVLGAQHVFIAFILLVLPVLIGVEAGISRAETASLVSMSLLTMGAVTLLQVRRIGPVGAGYLAPQITSAIYLPSALLAVKAGGLGMVFGMTLLSGVFGLVFSQIIGRLRKLFPPEVCGVVVLMIGLSIVRVALPRLFGMEGAGAPANPAALAVGIITLAVMVAVTITRVGRVRLYATVVGLLSGYVAAAAFGLIDGSTVEQLLHVPWFGIPELPSAELSFSPLLVLPFLIATIASNIKAVGLITSAQKTNDANWKRPDMRSVRGGIVADSIGNVVSGLLGGVGTSIGAGNIGLAAATGATARRIGVVVGILFIALAFVPKITAAITLMPAPVMGAGLLYTACFLVISGVELIVSRLLDSRRTFIVGLSILAGVGLDLMPAPFAGAPVWAAAFLSSPLAFATTLAVCLNFLFGIGVSKKAHLVLGQNGNPETIFHFFERWGAVWGARPDVIRRAGPAVVELWEESRSGGASAEMAIEMAFDEFRLAVDIRWNRQDFDGSNTNLERLTGHVQRRYGCRVKHQTGPEGALVRLEFEH